MDEGHFAQKLHECSGFADIFELVKDGVEQAIGKSRAGLTLGLANLGGSRHKYLGAYHPFPSNIIVMNSFPIKRIKETRQNLLKPYVFTILLHEYLHSLGYIDEATVRKMTFKICKKLFGEQHFSTDIARDITKFLPDFSYPNFGWFPDKHPEIEFVEGFDRGHITYIS